MRIRMFADCGIQLLLRITDTYPCVCGYKTTHVHTPYTLRTHSVHTPNTLQEVCVSYVHEQVSCGMAVNIVSL